MIDEHENALNDRSEVSFAVRAVGSLTGRRVISNLESVQSLLIKTQRIRANIENITFEHLDVASTVRYMAGVHIFISVHGAGLIFVYFMFYSLICPTIATLIIFSSFSYILLDIGRYDQHVLHESGISGS